MIPAGLQAIYAVFHLLVTVKNTHFMYQQYPNVRLVISLLLFGWAVYAFSQVTPLVFNPGRGGDHIIDIHLQECWTCFFDSGYVRQAAAQYNVERYPIYYFLDLIFPFIYSAAFFFLACGLKNKQVFSIYTGSLIACLLFDISENTSFWIYLSGGIEGWAWWVAVFTTLKSVLFLLNLLFALVAFLFPDLFGDGNQSITAMAAVPGEKM